MVVHLSDAIWAEGEAHECGIAAGAFTSYMFCFSQSAKNNLEQERVRQQLLEQLRNIKIREIKKDDDDMGGDVE